MWAPTSADPYVPGADPAAWTPFASTTRVQACQHPAYIGVGAARRRIKSEDIPFALGLVPARTSIITKDDVDESFDELRDLILQVGSHGWKHQVCSRSVARASPVFKEMIYGPSGEPRVTSDPWVISIPEDTALDALDLF
ncbi:nuclear pore protein-like protein [Colletotrichum plurivorum]|uniref:Nuclear pore protein-like protein n=1 Tax=Colletotrichum plurivorum TaxID=2175906 RepID=A0A8H6NIU6_9PEZI|nr:nuclear pore protein-like protein [Colletotrichum plurivorum]